jgi:hypothetical protein
MTRISAGLAAGGVPGAAHERRTFARIPADELHWVREVRLKYGPLVSLVDLSAGGALLRTNVQLRPGTVQVLEIVGNAVEAVPFRVLRCGISQITGAGVIYQGACEFKRPLDLKTSQGRDPARRARIDLVLHDLVLRQRAHIAGGPGSPEHPCPGRSLPRLLRSIQATALVNDPLARGLCDLLAEAVPALERGEPATVLRGRVEQQLRRTLPNIGVTISSAPLKPEKGTECIYFAAGEEWFASSVINVQLPAGSIIADWQFRLLQAGSYLLELLSTVGSGLKTERAEHIANMAADAESARAGALAQKPAAEPPSEVARAWQKIVARYQDGRLLKGFTHDFHPSRPHFSLWSSIDAAPSERVVIPSAQLKAVFFVRDFEGDPAHTDERVFDATHAGGRRLEVMFADGEVVVGSTLNYRPDGVGFFLNPADRRGNNQRVFVVSSAIRHVRFL